MPEPGKLYYFRDYVFPDGEQQHKYVLLMGKTKSDDWILARTTTKQNARPKDPACYLGYPYPGFYLDRAGDLLPLASWLVLNRLDDYDALDFVAQTTNGSVNLIGAFPPDLFCEALACAARADDTTREQDRVMRDLRVELGC